MSAPERIWLHPSAMTIYAIPPETNTLVQFVRADIAASQLAEARAGNARLTKDRDRLAARLSENNRWPDPLQSPQAEAIRNGKIDMTEIVSLFDKMERELEQLRLMAGERDRLAADNARLRAALEQIAVIMPVSNCDSGSMARSRMKDIARNAIRAMGEKK